MRIDWPEVYILNSQLCLQSTQLYIVCIVHFQPTMALRAAVVLFILAYTIVYTTQPVYWLGGKRRNWFAFDSFSKKCLEGKETSVWIQRSYYLLIETIIWVCSMFHNTVCIVLNICHKSLAISSHCYCFHIVSHLHSVMRFSLQAPFTMCRCWIKSNWVNSMSQVC